MPSWAELLQELEVHIDDQGVTHSALTVDELRQKYLAEYAKKTGRNVIAYYSGWLKPGKIQNIDINDSDITGFMNAIRGLDTNKGLDLILHTPGGNPTATEGIVKYLHSKFGNNIRAIVPQMAMSAGTMLACATNSIVLGKHSCIGPIDPQYGGVPAFNIITEFQEAKADLDNNPQAKTYWQLQLKKYPAAFFYTVMDAINLSSVLVSEWLTKYMFEDEDKKVVRPKVTRIIKTLNANNKSHSRHFSADFCKELGLKIIDLEADQDVQEMILSIHHAFVITIDNTNATKIIENQNGSRYITSQKK